MASQTSHTHSLELDAQYSGVRSRSERQSGEFANPQKRELACLWLSGTQAQMGAQYGRLMMEIGGWQPIADYYPRMAAQMLSVRANKKARQRMERALRVMLKLPTASLARARKKFFPEYEARTRAMLEAAGLPLSNADHFVVMDVFQNIIGLADRWGILPEVQKRAVIVGSCTSLAVWGSASSDGTLRTARNFDFPGVGRWDAAPSVVFCNPVDGLRYGYLGARGADVPGVTAFNEAGITVCAHTRFHRDVSFRQAAVVDIGHEIVRRAETLSDAVAIASKYPVASTWGFLVTSANEKGAAVIETNAKGIDVHWPAHGAQHVAHSNRYLVEQMREGQTGLSATFSADSDMRYARMDRAAQDAKDKGGLDAEGLCGLLGDHVDLEAVDHQQDGVRVAGNCVTSPITVQSVVFEPEQSRLRMSTGQAPTGWGPYVTVDWDWRSEPSAEIRSAESMAAHRSATGLIPEISASIPDTRSRTAYQDYVNISLQHLEGASYETVAAGVASLVEQLPEEPHFQYLQAMVLAQQGEFTKARTCLDKALAIEAGTFRRAQYLLWQSRVLSVLRLDAPLKEARAELAALSHPHIAQFQKEALREQKKPKNADKLKSIALDLMLIDAHFS